MLWLLIVLGPVVTLWLAAVVMTTDPDVPPGDVSKFKNILIVFPHADDETVNCGGTIHRFYRAGAVSTLVLLTAGERGNQTGAADEGLKARRMAEAKRVAKILGLSGLIQQDFGDGMLNERRQEVSEYLARTIRLVGADLLLTYDRAGLDGHPDHVACAEIMLELRRTQFPATTLWCAALPGRVVSVLRIARQLRTPHAIDQRRESPNRRIFVGAGVIPKIKAWYAYRSQRGLIAKGFGRLVPIWFAISAMQFEYFVEIT